MPLRTPSIEAPSCASWPSSPRHPAEHASPRRLIARVPVLRNLLPSQQRQVFSLNPPPPPPPPPLPRARLSSAPKPSTPHPLLPDERLHLSCNPRSLCSASCRRLSESRKIWPVSSPSSSRLSLPRFPSTRPQKVSAEQNDELTSSASQGPRLYGAPALEPQVQDSHRAHAGDS